MINENENERTKILVVPKNENACDICNCEYLCGGHNIGNGIQYVIKFDKENK